MKTHEIISDLLTFLDGSPTAWHAIDQIKKKLLQEGFTELQESETWKISLGKKYFITRNDSSICAFRVPSKTPESSKIIGSHTDSPSLKLKPNAEFCAANMTMLGTEVYGAPLLSSWLNRDLGIAGRVFHLDKNGEKVHSLVSIDDSPVIIPQLAVHLDRGVNETGLILNKQTHLAALAGVDVKEEFLTTLLEKKTGAKQILSHDLFLFPIERASLIGFQQQLFASYRIDSLNSVHAALNALTTAPKSNELQLVVFWDNEEVGSATAQGASSPFLLQILERITLALNISREQFLRFLSQSFCVSVDLAHGFHPSHPEKFEPLHQTLLNHGIVIKSNAQQRYASNADSVSTIIALCHEHKIPFQHFTSRNDMPCGSTLGPLQASSTGITTVDIGCPQLSMHSSREIAGCADHLHMCRLLEAFLAG